MQHHHSWGAGTVAKYARMMMQSLPARAGMTASAAGDSSRKGKQNTAHRTRGCCLMARPRSSMLDKCSGRSRTTRRPLGANSCRACTNGPFCSPRQQGSRLLLPLLEPKLCQPHGLAECTQEYLHQSRPHVQAGLHGIIRLEKKQPVPATSTTVSQMLLHRAPESASFVWPRHVAISICTNASQRLQS